MPSIFGSNNSNSQITGLSVAQAFTTGLLEVGRRSIQGVGLSASSRALTEEFISNVQNSFNSLMSLAAGPSLSVEGMLIQIKGLRATLPIGMLAESVTQLEEDTVPVSSNGQNVNTTA